MKNGMFRFVGVFIICVFMSAGYASSKIPDFTLPKGEHIPHNEYAKYGTVVQYGQGAFVQVAPTKWVAVPRDQDRFYLDQVNRTDNEILLKNPETGDQYIFSFGNAINVMEMKLTFTPANGMPVSSPITHVTKAPFPICQPNSEYTCTTNAAISGYNTKSVPTAGSLANCQKLCTEETDFVCKSFDFNKSSKACDLSDKSADDVGGLKTDYSGNPFDYYERINPIRMGVIPPDDSTEPRINATHVCESNSEYKCTPNAAISGYNAKSVPTAGSLANCQKLCTEETDFVCKSFDFNKSSKACDLSDKSAADVGELKKDYAGNPYDYYERLVFNVNKMSPDPTPKLLPTPVKNGNYNLINVKSGLCVIDENRSNEKPIVQSHCKDGILTAWTFVHKAGAKYEIRTAHRYCLSAGENENGENLSQINCELGGAPAREWTLIEIGNGEYTLTNSAGKCLDVEGASIADRAALQVWDCVSGTQQRFRILKPLPPKLIFGVYGIVQKDRTYQVKISDKYLLTFDPSDHDPMFGTYWLNDKIPGMIQGETGWITFVNPDLSSVEVKGVNNVVERPARPDKYDVITDRWMWLQLANDPRSSNYPFNELMIPGTHDSGAYELDLNHAYSTNFAPDKKGDSGFQSSLFFANDVVRNWGKTQSTNVLRQLIDGARYIDLRVCFDKDDTPRICHGVYGPDLSDIISDIKKFFDDQDHKKEVVVLDFQHLHTFNDKINQSQMDKLAKVLAPIQKYAISSTYEVNNPYHELIKHGNLIITMRKYASSEPKGFRDWVRVREDVLCDGWSDVGDSTSEQVSRIENKIKDCDAASERQKLSYNPFSVTPTVSRYTSELAGSLRDFAWRTNPVMLDKMACRWGKKRLNLVSMDFFTHEFIEAAISRNLDEKSKLECKNLPDWD